MARWTRFRRIFGPEPKEDVDEELAFHIEMRVRELVERGESPEHARERTLRRFGNYEQSRRECVEIDERLGRRMARTEYLTELRQDIGYALRMLRRAPGFTLVAVATLALGVGANSAIFSVVHGVLLQSLPYPAADRLYHVRTLYPDGTAYLHASAPDFMSVRADTRVFEQADAFTTGVYTMLDSGEPKEIRGVQVSDRLFDLLGFRVALGRGFRPDEHTPGAGGVAVLSHGFWQREFGGDRTVLQRSVRLGGASYAIVGVLAPEAELTEEAEIYMPQPFDASFNASTATRRRAEFLNVIARARPGVEAVAVDEDLRRIGTALQRQFPGTNETLTFNAIPLRTLIVGDVQTPLFVLLGAVGVVLLVACANVANLLLARASARQGELAVRAALGAGRGRLTRQLLTESLVLGLAGGAAGLAIAYWGTRALVAAQPANIPRLDRVGLNTTVVLFTLGIALLTGLAFGLLPALQATGVRLTRALREGGRGGGAGSAGHRLRATLVIAEMALAVVLLTGAGLLIRSFIELTRVDPGFRAEQGMAFRLVLQGDAYKEGADTRNRVDDLQARVRALPGVTAVAASTMLPLSGQGAMIDFRVENAPPPPPDVNQEIAIVSITPEYFHAIGTPLVRGRTFTDRDGDAAPLVALVNESAVRRWFGDRDPIGQRVNTSGRIREIVGIVRDVLQEHPGHAPAPQLFVPFAQRTTRTLRIVVRAAGDPLTLASAIRAQVRAVDPNLAITRFTPLQQLVWNSIARPRFYTSLLALFAGVALALAATGIFGVMSYAVAQRAREISIRMALGARAGDVLRMIVGRAIVLAAIGAVLGIAVALALGRVIQSQLFGVTLLDPLTLVSVLLVLSSSAAAASFLPARRAAALDPASALRDG